MTKVGHAAIGCGCSCASEPVLFEAMQRAFDWLVRLRGRGTTPTGPVSAIALRLQASGKNAIAVDWPLSRAMSSIPNVLLAEGDTRYRTGPYASITDPAEAAALRKLRVEGSNGAIATIVRNGAERYSLLLRDELPDEIAKSWPAMP